MGILPVVYSLIGWWPFWFFSTFWPLWIMLYVCSHTSHTCVFISLELMCRTGILGLHGNYTFNISETAKLFPKWLYYFSFPITSKKINSVGLGGSTLSHSQESSVLGPTLAWLLGENSEFLEYSAYKGVFVRLILWVTNLMSYFMLTAVYRERLFLL